MGKFLIHNSFIENKGKISFSLISFTAVLGALYEGNVDVGTIENSEYRKIPIFVSRVIRNLLG